MSNFPSDSFSQHSCFPVNQGTGQIEIVGRVLLEGKTKDEIFNKCVTWGTPRMSNLYSEKHEFSSAQGRTIMEKDAGIYKVYFQINYSYKKGYRSILYAMTIQTGDGYFDYTINDFIMNDKPMLVYLNYKAGDKYYNIAFEDICQKLYFTIGELRSIQ